MLRRMTSSSIVSQPSRGRKSREAVNRETGRILVPGDASDSNESSPSHVGSANDQSHCSDTLTSSVVMPRAWMHLGAIKYYMKFAMAMYGWPLYMFMNTCSGSCRLCASYRWVLRIKIGQCQHLLILCSNWICRWCNGYRFGTRNLGVDFKLWSSLLNSILHKYPWVKVCIHLVFHQLWVK